CLNLAISLMLLSAVALSLYIFVAVPVLSLHAEHERNDVQAVSIILTLWIATALVYPLLHSSAAWLVDKVIFKRADYTKLQVDLTRRNETIDSPSDLMNEACQT